MTRKVHAVAAGGPRPGLQWVDDIIPRTIFNLRVTKWYRCNTIGLALSAYCRLVHTKMPSKNVARDGKL